MDWLKFISRLREIKVFMESMDCLALRDHSSYEDLNADSELYMLYLGVCKTLNKYVIKD